jgi:Porin subfamily
MKMIKGLVLGSAASLVALSGAQAADLPIKAKAVEYVRVCSLYGAGFYYMPGTDTCIKLGGYLRVDVLANSNAVDTGNTTSPAGLGNRFSNAYTWQSREDLNIDTRTATEYGVVRTFFDGVFTWGDDSYTANNGTGNPLGTTYAQIANGVGQSSNASSGLTGKGTLGVYFAYVQFAGFTMGKAISPFSTSWTNYPGNNFDGLVGGSGTVTGVNQFDYTAQFGNGVSTTIAAVDPTQYFQAGVLNFGAFGSANSTGVNDYAGTAFPDIVGNINVTQAWGMAQLSVAAHDNNPAYYANSGAGSIVTGHPDDKWGYAIQGSISINNIPTGPGDTINAQVVYTDGATRYNIQDLASNTGAWSTFNGKATAGTLGSIGIGVAPDSVFNAGGAQHLISTWGGRGAFNHNWDPYWSSSLYGAYAHVDYGSAGAATFCASLIATQPGVTSCNPNYNIAQAGFITRWTPVKNLAFSADFTWEHLSQNNVGTITTSGSYGTGAYTIANQNTYQLLFRALRIF